MHLHSPYMGIRHTILSLFPVYSVTREKEGYVPCHNLSCSVCKICSCAVVCSTQLLGVCGDTKRPLGGDIGLFMAVKAADGAGASIKIERKVRSVT